MNDTPQHASATRITRLLREAAGPTAPVQPLKGPTTSQKVSVRSVGASLFLLTFVGLAWIELGPLVENPGRTALTSEVLTAPRVSDATDPSLPAAASALSSGVDDADAPSAPTF